jgi:hypothetical protein
LFGGLTSFVKLTLIMANVIAAIAVYVLGGMAEAAHQAHAFSVYRELQEQHVLAERPDYDVKKRLATIADGGGYYLVLSRFGAVGFLVNATAVAFLWRRQKSRGQISK